MSSDCLHPYVSATANDSRSPCPGLNALANHGYLPHNGKDITMTALISAVHKVYNISQGVAASLTLAALALCGHWMIQKDGAMPLLDRVLNLHDLARHGRIEHDGSLVHDDAPNPDAKFAPVEVDQKLLAELLAQAPAGCDALTLAELCRMQVERQDASRPLDCVHRFFAEGEVGLLYEVLGVPASEVAGCKAEKEGDMVVPKRFLEQWLGQERLPDGWQRPQKEIGQMTLSPRMKEIVKLESTLRK